MLISVNHHYVPQLYLKGFTADNGKIQVFDKALLGFKKDIQTPKTICFEKHRNTIDFKGCPTDQVERLYSLIEAPFGNFFNHIRKGITQDELISEVGIGLLKKFIAIQFWRMPLLDDFAHAYIQKLDLSKFGDRITINGSPLGKVKEISHLLKTDKGFRHYFRSFYLPFLTFDLRVHESDYQCWRLYSVAKEDSDWDNLLTGDNSFIVEKITDIFSFKSKLLFPLSKNQLVIYSPAVGAYRDFLPVFSTKLSMAMFFQSQRYFIGANREYMKKVLELQRELYAPDEVPKLFYELFQYV